MLRLKKVSIIVLILFILSNSYVYGNMDSFMDNLITDYQEYYQQPGLYESGTRGYLSLGAYSMRYPEDKYGVQEILNLRPPRLNLSCSGIDFEAGGMSYLDWDTIKQLFSDSGSTLVASFLVALAYTVPTIENIISYINKYSNMAMQLYYEPCKVGQYLGKSTGEALKSYYADQEKTKEMQEGKEPIEIHKEYARNPDKLVDKLPEGNIIWDQLEKVDGITSDMIEPIINITGTVVFYKKKDEKGKDNWHAEELKGPVQPRVLLNGGKTDYYRFSGTKHQEYSIGTETIKGIIKPTEEKLAEIVDRMNRGDNVSEEDLKAISSPSFPKLFQLISSIAKINSKAQRDLYVMGLAPVLALDKYLYIFNKVEDIFNKALYNREIQGSETAIRKIDSIRNDFYRKKEDIIKQLDYEVSLASHILRMWEDIDKVVRREMSGKGWSWSPESLR